MKSNKNTDVTEKKLVEENSDVTLVKPKVKPKVKRVTKKKTEKVYSEEDLNVTLYYEISSTIYNSLNNLIVRKSIFSNEELLKILELQISNLFFLEKELKELKDKKYAIEFLQLISNLINRSLSITKSSPKNRIEILEERNLLIVTISNICKTVEKESLERIRQFDDNTFNELNDQITALNNFSDDVTEVKPSVTPNNQNVDTNPNIGDIGNLGNNLNVNNLDNNSLANLAKLGVLPQHPATNPKFYPYMNKPKYTPLLKKILSAFFLLTTVLSIATYILTYFIAGTFQIKDSSTSPVYYNFAQQSKTIVFTIVVTIVLNGGFLYSILKPPKLGRDLYRTSYFLIVILIFWIIYTISNLFYMTTDDSLLRTFTSFLDKGDKINPNAFPWLKGLATFKAFQILTYITAASAILPIAIILVIAILNPKIDRNKIMRANSEYQNAINNALSGKPYEIDPSLFDDSLDNDNKKDKKDHKFWRNSDLFKPEL